MSYGIDNSLSKDEYADLNTYWFDEELYQKIDYPSNLESLVQSF